jgi:hypothetical protein
LPSTIESFFKVGGATAAGAFLGALSLNEVPTTLIGWKVVLAPALGAAIAAEVVYLRQQIAAFLASQAVIAAPEPKPSAPPTPGGPS